jgi:hypothetical protein
MSRADRRRDRPDSIPPFAGDPSSLNEAFIDPDVEGLPAVVTIRIPGGDFPGEVRLYVRGTFETLIAYAVEPIEVGRHVRVATSRGARAARVEPTINGA